MSLAVLAPIIVPEGFETPNNVPKVSQRLRSMFHTFGMQDVWGFGDFGTWGTQGLGDSVDLGTWGLGGLGECGDLAGLCFGFSGKEPFP